MEVLYYCVHDGLFAHKALSEVGRARRPDERTRASATEMAFGSIRMMLRLDYLVGRASGRNMGDIEAHIACVLRLAAYQLLHMKGEAAFAVVDSAVEQAKRLSNPGAAGFVNAVLRKIAAPGFELALPAEGDPIKRISIETSHPEWIVRGWIGRFGEDRAARMCSYDNEAPPASIRVNFIKGGRQALIEALRAEGREAAPGTLSESALRLRGWSQLSSDPLFEGGFYSIQDESSMLVAEAICPKEGELVLDMCSAPGGKACHAAELSEDRARVLAFDSNPARLALVEGNAKRLGLSSVRAAQADATRLHESFEGTADAVMADVPCSGLGVLARRPDARWRKDPSQIPGFAATGAAILDSAAKCLKKGGRLAFSTCTVAEEENEGQVASFLAGHPEFSAVPLQRLEDMGISERGSGMAQLLQGVHGSDGFFLALLRKN